MVVIVVVGVLYMYICVSGVCLELARLQYAGVGGRLENGVNEGSKKHTDTNERKRGDEAKLLNLSDLPFGYERQEAVT